ncbi:MAG TPA: PAS domain S-box protein [Gemmatimonadales bacterium]|nr:PAS domain S-box protein [Gemmatimonadales bacterium]
MTPRKGTKSKGTAKSAKQARPRGGAAARLRELEERTALLFDANPHPMWVYDRATLRFLAVNDTAVQVYGYSRAQFLRMTIAEIRPPEDLDQLRLAVDQTADGTRYSGIWTHLTKDGKPLTVAISSHQVTYEGRDAALVLAMDITPQRELAAQLASERARLVEAQRVTQVGSWETDLVTLRVTWSEETFRIFGLDPETFRPQHDTFLRHVHPDDQAAVDAAFRRSFADRALHSIEHRIVLADGTVKWVEERWRTLAGADGRPALAVGTCQDITARREAAAERERALTLQRVATTLTRLGWFTVDLRTGARRWSEEVSAIFDLAPGETPDLAGALSFYAPGSRERMRQLYDTCVREGVPYDAELEAVTARGRQIWVRTIGEPVRDADGRIIGLQGALQDVTGAHNAARELAESEERFRRTFAAAAIGIVITTADGHILEANEAFCRMIGYDRDELRTRTILDLTHPDDVGPSRALMEELAGTDHEERTFEKRYRTRDGRTLWVRLSVAAPGVLGDADATFVTVVEDITREREAQQALRLSEERFRLLAKATNDAIWDWDLVTQALWWNEGFETLFGYRRDEIEPTVVSWTSRVHPDDHDRVVNGIHARIDAGAENWVDEYRFRRKDGSYAWVLDRGHIIRGPDGAALRMIGGMTDLTARREAEERLAQQAALLDAAHEAILVKDLDDHIVYWNKGAERTYGWMAHEALGHPAGELLRADPARYAEARGKLLRQGQWEGELVLRGRDDLDRPMDVRWSVVFDDQRRPRSIFALHTDVSERKRLESQVLRAQRLESLGTLAGGIAHDLNNVLTPILASIELLREETDERERQEALDTIQASARRGAEMVRQVLTFARGTEGRRVALDVAAIVRDVERILRETLPKHVALRVTAPAGLWPVEADATQLHQVVMNLCVNARDAMPFGGVLTLELANDVVDDTYAAMHPSSAAGPYVRLTVADTGVGIPAAVQERLFEPFFTTKEVGKGTGLGLSTAHTIVTKHGGFINVYSEPGKGARFNVYLPARTDAVAAEPTPAPTTALPRGRGERILVVDDEEPIREIVRRTLERFGYQVVLAGHGAEGVSIYARDRGRIAAVLTDMAMPVMDGPAMIIALKAMDPAVRIIGSSGMASNESISKAMGAGVTHFVPKPYTAETLLTTLRDVLAR